MNAMSKKTVDSKSLSFKFQVVSLKDASGECIIEGYANTSSKDRVGDVVLPEAFTKSLPTYQKNPIILLNHDWNDVIGRCVGIEVTDKGLFIRARISDTRTDIKTLIQEGCYSTFSIGYNEVDSEYDEYSKTKYIKELELLEISVVSVPANTEAMFTQIVEKTEETTQSNEKAKSVKELKAFITDVKEIVGKGFDDESMIAAIEYFNKNEDIMTKQELIDTLKTKSAVENTQVTEEKNNGTEQQGAKEQMQHEDAMQGFASKLDALAQMLMQLNEKIDKLGKEESSEQSEEASEPEQEAEQPAAEQQSSEDQQKACADDKEKEDMEDEQQKDLSLEQIDKDLAELTSTIDSLDEEING